MSGAAVVATAGVSATRRNSSLLPDRAAETNHHDAIDIAGASAAVVTGSAAIGVVSKAAGGAAAVAASDAIIGLTELAAAETTTSNFIVTADGDTGDAAGIEDGAVRVAD